jgi:hypothetical protein
MSIETSLIEFLSQRALGHFFLWGLDSQGDIWGLKTGKVYSPSIA